MKEKIFNIYGQMTYNEISDNKNCLIIPSAETKKQETRYVPVEDVIGSEVVNDYFKYIVLEGKTPQKLKEIDDDLRAAASYGRVSMLIDTLSYHQSMGNINVLYVSSKILYDTLKERYGLRYTYENFRKARAVNRIITPFGSKR